MKKPWAAYSFHIFLGTCIFQMMDRNSEPTMIDDLRQLLAIKWVCNCVSKCVDFFKTTLFDHSLNLTQYFDWIVWSIGYFWNYRKAINIQVWNVLLLFFFFFLLFALKIDDSWKKLLILKAWYSFRWNLRGHRLSFIDTLIHFLITAMGTNMKNA